MPATPLLQRDGRSRLGLAVVCAVALVMAGCASGPGRSGGASARGSSGMPTVVPKPGAASPSERDGPPSPAEAPSVAQLKALPDPVPQVEPIRDGGPNKPYSVLGQSYEPLTRDVPVKERGVASWYGKKFHGHRTASGELFSMYGLTAAHRTLPIPSYARVTDVATGKSIIVRVNDRGPFHSSRVMDLSYAAAVKLGIAARGSAQIEVERLTFDDIRTGAWKRDDDLAVAAAPLVPPAPVLSLPAPTSTPTPATTVAAAGAAVSSPVSVPDLRPTPVPASDPDPIEAVAAQTAAQAAPGPAVTPALPVPSQATPVKAFTPFSRGYWVQLAALGKRDGVDRLQQRIASDMQGLLPMLAVFHEAPYFKLQVGPYSTREEAVAAADQARATLSVSPMVIERR